MACWIRAKVGSCIQYPILCPAEGSLDQDRALHVETCNLSRAKFSSEYEDGRNLFPFWKLVAALRFLASFYCNPYLLKVWVTVSKWEKNAFKMHLLWWKVLTNQREFKFCLQNFASLFWSYNSECNGVGTITLGWKCNFVWQKCIL